MSAVFGDFVCEVVNKNKKSVPGSICVHVCSTQILSKYYIVVNL